MIDVYGDQGENYPISMENRPGRMKRIETQHVMEKVALWNERYGRGKR
jgi:heptosyltransferase I